MYRVMVKMVPVQIVAVNPKSEKRIQRRGLPVRKDMYTLQCRQIPSALSFLSIRSFILLVANIRINRVGLSLFPSLGENGLFLSLLCIL